MGELPSGTTAGGGAFDAGQELEGEGSVMDRGGGTHGGDATSTESGGGLPQAPALTDQLLWDREVVIPLAWWTQHSPAGE